MRKEGFKIKLNFNNLPMIILTALGILTAIIVIFSAIPFVKYSFGDIFKDSSEKLGDPLLDKNQELEYPRKDGSQEQMCIPDCQGKQCGYDGCGGSCGKCNSSHLCIGGICELKIPECIDSDADGYNVSEGSCGVVDCNDSNKNIYPGANELCNYIDDDCDNVVDEGVKKIYYKDDDSDGYGRINDSVEDCFAPENYVSNNDDCNDSNEDMNPDEQELCDNKDNNCDGSIDEGCNCTIGQTKECGVTDVGECDYGLQTCNLSGKWGDCTGNRNPSDEVCDNKDNDCDGFVDNNIIDCSGETPYCLDGSCVECIQDSHCYDSISCTDDYCFSGGCLNNVNDSKCELWEICNNLQGCVQNICSGCYNCEGWFEECGYDDCHLSCEFSEDCYFRGNVVEEDCMPLSEACQEISSCSDYSVWECSDDPCNVNMEDGCYNNSESCYSASYCGDGNCDFEENCDNCFWDCNCCEEIWWRPGHGETWYEDNPTYFDSNNDTASWDFSTPEAQGMDSQILEEGISSLESEPYLYSILIIRHDTIVLERYFKGSAADHSNNIHSASKSFYPALVAIAIEEGYISGVNQKVSEIVPDYFSDFSPNNKKRDITIKHLMTMTMGLRWEEDVTEYEIERKNNWVQEVLNLRLDYDPGEHFEYSTGSPHILSAVITEATGMSTCEFAHNNLFKPLNITAEHWGRDPQDIYSGGYNFYITPREMARFGLLYLHNGEWNGEQVIPQWMVEESVQPYNRVDRTYDYGYYWWLRQISGYDVYIAWGWGGQFIHVIPELDIVFVSTADTESNSEGREINADRFIRRYVIPSVDEGLPTVKQTGFLEIIKDFIEHIF
ncbi:serine hydrolase [Candidatus Pacearchaeota archaeon]|nr:serine hydrolase [Candidatus Pacearchaeota archaeon]MBD3283156.1 serine hydrolase [Candidatus Pacearchaeota archaeon]